MLGLESFSAHAVVVSEPQREAGFEAVWVAMPVEPVVVASGELSAFVWAGCVVEPRVRAVPVKTADAAVALPSAVVESGSDGKNSKTPKVQPGEWVPSDDFPVGMLHFHPILLEHFDSSPSANRAWQCCYSRSAHQPARARLPAYIP